MLTSKNGAPPKIDVGLEINGVKAMFRGTADKRGIFSGNLVCPLGELEGFLRGEILGLRKSRKEREKKAAESTKMSAGN